MNRKQESRARRIQRAMRQVDECAAMLLFRARAYTGCNGSHDTAQVLEAGRDYGRACERLSRARLRK